MAGKVWRGSRGLKSLRRKLAVKIKRSSVRELSPPKTKKPPVLAYALPVVTPKNQMKTIFSCRAAKVDAVTAQKLPKIGERAEFVVETAI
jgi:hypothetical protein